MASLKLQHIPLKMQFVCSSQTPALFFSAPASTLNPTSEPKPYDKVSVMLINVNIVSHRLANVSIVSRRLAIVSIVSRRLVTVSNVNTVSHRLASVNIVNIVSKIIG